MSVVSWDETNKGSNVSITNSGLTASIAGFNGAARASAGRVSGKWYWEVIVNTYMAATGNIMIGVVDNLVNMQATQNSGNFIYYLNSGTISGIGESGESFNVGDTVGISLNLDDYTIEFYKNGVGQGKHILESRFHNVDIYPAISNWQSNTVSGTGNFGATLFNHSIPEGYKSYDGSQSNIQPVDKTLILNRNEYKKFDDNGWQTVSTTLPTDQQFQEEGMEDLSIFDREVQPVLDSPIQMTKELLGEGKVFKGKVDLKKYFDLRKLEVK